MRPGHPHARVAVLASGAGTILQSVLDAGDPLHVVVVGADRRDAPALDRARTAGVDTFTVEVADHPDRASWDEALTARLCAAQPDLVVLAGFMRLVGPALLDAFEHRVLNTHPALLPAFPGMHGPADALAYGVTVSGATLFIVDSGTDTGPIIDQRTVPVLAEDTVDRLHERIKQVEREMMVRNLAAMARTGWTVQLDPQRRKVTMP